MCVCVQHTVSDAVLINVRHAPHCGANFVKAIYITDLIKQFTVAINL